MMRLLSALIMSLLLAASTARAQQSSPPPAAQQSLGVITGRVVSSEGNPVPDASITATPYIGGTPGKNYSALTDEEGSFRITNLPPGNYTVYARAESYLSTSLYRDQNAKGDDRYYHPGDSITITLPKGSVITGKVASAKGEAIIGVVVSAFQTGRLDGPRSERPFLQKEVPTDDRGVYRLYGLQPGIYIIAAQGRGRNISYVSGYDGNAPVYYPSSTRADAEEVTVRAGEEASRIDITYRHEPGHLVKGTVTGSVGTTPNDQPSLYLGFPGGGSIAQTYSISEGNTRTFTFYGVPEGEYEIRAERRGYGNDEGAIALPLRVTVKDEDVTGLNLKLMPFGAIAGRVVLNPASDLPATCQINRQPLTWFASVIAFLDLPERQRTKESEREQADKQGAFQLRRLEPGLYRFRLSLASYDWYVRAVMRPAAAANQPPFDVAHGLTLNLGERAEGITITLAEGAAYISGQVIAATEGAPLPARLRIHLIPAEPEQAHNVLRFAETTTYNNGLFRLANLVPGRYWLLMHPAPDDPATERDLRPAAWDAEGRAKLRREAEAAKIEIELQPCQHVSNYALRYAPASKQ